VLAATGLGAVASQADDTPQGTTVTIADQPKPDNPPPGIKIGKPAFYERCPSSQKAIGFYRQKYRRHREKMGQPGPVPRVWYGCDAARRRATEWRARATKTAAAYTTWLQQRTLATNDWRTAVRLTQRVFPGTEDWLLYISDREGGYGPFVMNHQGSGAGGWMQFMASTFYAYSDDARASVRARGFKVDPAVFTWTHPLGQALTAGYMRFFGRDGCHWCL
jgi:hypothetical protein